MNDDLNLTFVLLLSGVKWVYLVPENQYIIEIVKFIYLR